MHQHQHTLRMSGGVCLTWKDLSIKMPTSKGKQRVLLHKVSGYAEPGSVVAIMGPSGSGKTTLLDALAGRLKSSMRQSGDILVNGRQQQLSYGNLAYVSQDDSLISTLSVYETILYSAHLQLPDTMSNAERISRVNRTIKEMGLQDCTHTKIGGWYVRGLSGGEKRRVSIAIEILKHPQLLFLDEPTSGLDSAAAYHVMRRLRDLVKDGRTIITSIHQPSSEIFGFFHSLCLLSAGKTVYFGEANKAQQFFALAGFPCPSFRNPSDHFLWVINAEFEEHDIEVGEGSKSTTLQDIEMGSLISKKMTTTQKVELLLKAYKCSDVSKAVETKIQEMSLKEGDVLSGGDQVSIWRQSFYLTSRSFLNMHRNLAYYWFRLFIYTVLSICVGTIYYRIGVTYDSIQARAAMLMFIVAFMTYLAVVSFPSFIEDMKIYTRERLNGHYGVAAFVAANFMSSFPFLFLLSSIPGTILYFLGGLHQGWDHFLFFLATLLACLVAVEGLLMAIASMVPDFLTGIIAGAGIQGIYLLNGGFFRLLNDLPKPVWRYPMSYIAFHTYANRAFYNNDFSGLYFENSKPGGPLIPGDYILEHTFQMKINYSKWWDVVVLVAMALFYRLLFFFCLKLREKLNPKFIQKLKIHGNMVCRSSYGSFVSPQSQFGEQGL